jgi:hypothetical protein
MVGGEVPSCTFAEFSNGSALRPTRLRETYLAECVGSVVLINMNQKVRPKDGVLEPWTRQRWGNPHRRNSTIGRALAMCRQGTTLSQLRKFAKRNGIVADWLLYYLKASWIHGCQVVLIGDEIKLLTPIESRRRQPGTVGRTRHRPGKNSARERKYCT